MYLWKSLGSAALGECTLPSRTLLEETQRGCTRTCICFAFYERSIASDRRLLAREDPLCERRILFFFLAGTPKDLSRVKRVDIYLNCAIGF